jgi:hypothetical protein
MHAAPACAKRECMQLQEDKCRPGRMQLKLLS